MHIAQSFYRYYIQIVQGNAPNTSSVYVALRSDKSPVTASMSGDGLDEIQEIMVNSTVSPEEQVNELALRLECF